MSGCRFILIVFFSAHDCAATRWAALLWPSVIFNGSPDYRQNYLSNNSKLKNVKEIHHCSNPCLTQNTPCLWFLLLLKICYIKKHGLDKNDFILNILSHNSSPQCPKAASFRLNETSASSDRYFAPLPNKPPTFEEGVRFQLQVIILSHDLWLRIRISFHTTACMLRFRMFWQSWDFILPCTDLRISVSEGPNMVGVVFFSLKASYFICESRVDLNIQKAPIIRFVSPNDILSETITSHFSTLVFAESCRPASCFSFNSGTFWGSLPQTSVMWPWSSTWMSLDVSWLFVNHPHYPFDQTGVAFRLAATYWVVGYSPIYLPSNICICSHMKIKLLGCGLIAFILNMLIYIFMGPNKSVQAF